jgi:hypothetical protein
MVFLSKSPLAALVSYLAALSFLVKMKAHATLTTPTKTALKMKNPDNDMLEKVPNLSAIK